MTKLTNRATKAISNSLAIALLLAIGSGLTFARASHDNDREEYLVDVIASGDIAQIKGLLDGELDVNQNIEGDGTPLIIAIHNGHTELVEYLVTVGADVNLESLQDGNPLIAAALSNNLALVEYLYEQGAAIDAITQYDETALISASRAGHFQIVEYLVNNGADVNLAVHANVRYGKELRSPLNGAKTQKIRDFLLANGAE